MPIRASQQCEPGTVAWRSIQKSGTTISPSLMAGRRSQRAGLARSPVPYGRQPPNYQLCLWPFASHPAEAIRLELVRHAGIPASEVHENCEQEDNRKRNSDKPEKCAFAKTHISLLLQLQEQRSRKGCCHKRSASPRRLRNTAWPFRILSRASAMPNQPARSSLGTRRPL